MLLPRLCFLKGIRIPVRYLSRNSLYKMTRLLFSIRNHHLLLYRIKKEREKDIQRNLKILLQNERRKGKILFAAAIAQLVERLIRNHQVKGSSPFIGSIFYRGVAQFGSAFGSGPKGRRFKSWGMW